MRAIESKFRSFNGEVKGVNAERRTVSGYASTGDVDRYGEVIEPRAFKKRLAKFMRNPLFLAGHRHVLDSGEPAVLGSILSAHVDTKGLAFEARFDSDPLASAWFEKFRSGSLKGFSVGFIPITWEDRPIMDPETGVVRVVRHYTEVELLEISAVPIPACPSALAAGYGGDVLGELLTEVKALRTALGGPDLDVVVDEICRESAEQFERDFADGVERADPYSLDDGPAWGASDRDEDEIDGLGNMSPAELKKALGV